MSGVKVLGIIFAVIFVISWAFHDQFYGPIQRCFYAACWALSVCAVAFGMHACEGSDWNQERRRQDAAQAAADAVPRVVREVDGCKVYAFKGGDRWHYFTRCPDGRVTTDSTYTVRSGKTTKTLTESITTN